jgi:hypothetical protein
VVLQAPAGHIQPIGPKLIACGWQGIHRGVFYSNFEISLRTFLLALCDSPLRSVQVQSVNGEKKE